MKQKLPTFKYKASFASLLAPRREPEVRDQVSLAALEEIKKIIPESAYGKADILPIAFDACNVNLGNKNHEVIDTETAIDIHKSFIHKPINAEHVRPDIIGHVVSAGFSKFDPKYLSSANSELIGEEFVIENYLENNGIFNICLGGVLYILVDTETCAKIYESGDPDSENYRRYSASWELGFSDYVFAAGSFRLADCEIIEDEAEIERLTQYAKFNGGSGFLPDGRPLLRWIHGSVHALGIGITETQAGHVKGIVSDFIKDKDEEDGKNDDESGAEAEAQESVAISHQEIEHVTINKDEKPRDIIMKTIKNIEELKALTDAEFAEVSVASIKDVLEAEIKKISEEYAKQVDAEKQARESAVKTSEESAAKLKELEEKLGKIEEEQSRATAEQKFNERMSLLDEKFNLGDSEREIIVAEIKAMDDDGFDAWLKKFSILAKALAKDFVDPKAQQLTKEIEGKDAEIEELKKAKTSTASVPNTISSDEPLKERLAKSFKEHFKIEV